MSYDLLRSVYFLCALMFSFQSLAAAQSSLNVSVNLDDGSKIVGTPTMESLRLITSETKQMIPLRSILELTMKNGHATVKLRDGDLLAGNVNPSSFPIQTKFGLITLRIEYVQSISFSGADDGNATSGSPSNPNISVSKRLSLGSTVELYNPRYRQTMLNNDIATYMQFCKELGLEYVSAETRSYDYSERRSSLRKKSYGFNHGTWESHACQEEGGRWDDCNSEPIKITAKKLILRGSSNNSTRSPADLPLNW